MGKNFIGSFPEINFRAYLLNNFLCDLFFIKNDTDFARYADDNTPYTIRNDMEMLFPNYEIRQKQLFEALFLIYSSNHFILICFVFVDFN